MNTPVRNYCCEYFKLTLDASFGEKIVKIMDKSEKSEKSDKQEYGKEHDWRKLSLVLFTIISFIIAVGFNSLQSVFYSSNTSKNIIYSFIQVRIYFMC